MASNISKLMVLFALLSIAPSYVSALSNGLYVTCYNSKGWCEAECAMPCYYINYCNGFRFMHACPSTLLLFLFILACIVVLGLLISCIIVCCCRCRTAAKATKNKRESRQNDAIFRKDIVQPAQIQRPPISHHISLNAFDDFPSTQVHVTPAPRVSVDSDSSNGWQMNFLKPDAMNDELRASKKSIALHYK